MAESFESRFIDSWLALKAAGWTYTKTVGPCWVCCGDKPLFERDGEMRCKKCAGFPVAASMPEEARS